jgi:exopolysaccharide biosynthesis protein
MAFVLSATGKYQAELLKLKKNQRVVLVSNPTPIEGEPIPLRISFVEHAVAGVPRLIKNGKIDITWEQEKASKSFVETRHPRTAVAKMKDGKFLMITVDGRQPGVSVGMSLYELADYLLSIGAVDAMNLDGGGSTTMFLDGRVVNTPSDKEGERKVSDAILVTLRKKKP